MNTDDSARQRAADRAAIQALALLAHYTVEDRDAIDTLWAEIVANPADTSTNLTSIVAALLEIAATVNEERPPYLLEWARELLVRLAVREAEGPTS